MLFQVGISTALSATRVAYYSYYVITANEQKTTYQKTMDSFFAQLTTQLFYLNYAKSFYINTLSSKYFRKIFLQRIIRIWQPLLPIRANTSRLRQRSVPTWKTVLCLLSTSTSNIMCGDKIVLGWWWNLIMYSAPILLFSLLCDAFF